MFEANSQPARRLRRILRLVLISLATGVAGCAGSAISPPVTEVPSETVAVPARGRLLYETACASCHNRKTHWRNRHWVTDWSTLTSQVRKWQTIAGQNWGGEEIDDVAAYLNRRFYNVPCPLPGCTTGKVG